MAERGEGRAGAAGIYRGEGGAEEGRRSGRSGELGRLGPEKGKKGEKKEGGRRKGGRAGGAELRMGPARAGPTGQWVRIGAPWVWLGAGKIPGQRDWWAG